MRTYEISKGTKALLLENPSANPHIVQNLRDGDCIWETRNFTTTKDLLFVGDEMIVDPIRTFNGNSYIDNHSTAYKLAERGYVVFTVNPNVRQKYLLAVPFASVTIK